VAAGDVTGAFEELDAVILAFASRATDADATYVSVANAAEFANFRVEHPSVRVVWLDWSYGEAFRMRAFLLASQQRFVEALAALKEGARIARRWLPTRRRCGCRGGFRAVQACRRRRCAASESA
jgi:hypothetical protein